MSPSMVPSSLHDELALVLLEELTGGKDGPCQPIQSARMAVLAALCQTETSDASVCGQTVLGLSKVRAQFGSINNRGRGAQYSTI